MANAKVGVNFHERNARAIFDAALHAEAAGVPTLWLTTGSGPDALTVFPAIAAATQHIRMGTAIVPTFPRHPVVTAQQSADIASLAPNRFVLGVGPSHAPVIEARYGLAYRRPLEHMREFVQIVTGLLAGQEVTINAKHFKLKAKLSEGADVPVIVSALRIASFELAGECTDGAVSWLCAAPYLRDVAMPALARGAANAGRARPKLIGHAFVALTRDRNAVRVAVEENLMHYPRWKNYQEMFAAAGFPEAREGKWSDAMIAGAVLHGTEDDCAKQVAEFLRVSTCDELILSVLPAGMDRPTAIRRTLDWIGAL